MPFTKETAKAAAAKAVEARRAAGVQRKRDDRDPLTPVRRALRGLFEDLLHASRATGPYARFRDIKCPECNHEWRIREASLSPAERLAATKTLIAYGLGRPVGIDKAPAATPAPSTGADDDTDAVEPEGITFG